MKITLVGPYPDYNGTIGGVSIHLKRIRKHLLLKKHHPIVYALTGRGNPAEEIYPVSKPKWQLPLVMLREQRSLMHLHTSAWKLWVMNSFVCRFRLGRTVLTLHGDDLRMAWEDVGPNARRLMRSALRKFDHIVVVNDHVGQMVQEVLGPYEKMSVIPAFVPPVPEEADRLAVPSRVWEFVREHSPIVSMNGWVVWLRQTEDLYGFDLMLRALRDLRKDFPNLGVIAAICGIPDTSRDLWDRLQATAKELGVDRQICWVTEGCEYYPILEKSNLMIRPTRTDGWPLSIGEAMYFGVPVIASDVCVRPERTVLFANGDADDLAAKMRRVLNGSDRPHPIVLDYHEKLIALYEKLGT